MNFELFVKPRAERDLFEAYRLYEKHSKGLGGEFVRTVDVRLEFIQQNPLAYPVKYRDFRQAFLQRFPYGIY